MTGLCGAQERKGYRAKKTLLLYERKGGDAKRVTPFFPISLAIQKQKVLDSQPDRKKREGRTRLCRRNGGSASISTILRGRRPAEAAIVGL